MNRLITGSTLVLFLLSLCCMQVSAQQKTIAGVVLNQDTREPLEGVTVSIRGSNKNTVTNEKGEFSIPVSGNESVLKFSYTGFTYQEFPVGSKKSLSVSLAKDNKGMDEVVIVGYGAQKKAHLTGAIVSVQAKDLEDLPLGNLAATLQGRFAGVGVNGGTARPGENASITIRNPVILSKDGGTLSPLYVIDDVIRSEEDFNLLDATEVENISVLKDAAAAIYGARASQGVVVVRTRRGKAGKTQISFNSSASHTNSTYMPKMMNGFQHATYLNNMNITNGKPLTDPLIYAPDELEHFQKNNYDWLKMAWKPSYLTRHAINVSGGTDKATFFAGVSYFAQDGNFDNINMNKWTFRASADVKVATGLKFGLSVSGDLYNKEMYLLKQGGENPENDMKGLLYTPQFTPPYVNGLPVKMSTSSNQNTIDAFHFFEAQRLNNYNRSRNVGLNVVANLEYQVPFIKGLSAKVQYGKILDNTFPKQFGTRYKVYSFDMEGSHNHIYGGEVLPASTTLTNGNRIYMKPSYGDKYQLNGYLSYNRKFGKHDITALAVVEQSEYKYDDVQAIVEDPIEGALDNMRYAFGLEDTYETESESGNLSYIGRINYGFANKYLAELSFRYDASTNFAPENRWGFFPSVSAGWIISEEKFFSPLLDKVNFLKLRASAGMLGGDATKPYQWFQRYTPQPTGGAVFGGNNSRSVGMKTEAMPNRAARWDDDTKLNAGLDARFLNDRLSATVEAFHDHRYNMLTTLSASVPLLVGSNMPSENFSTVNSFGYEISLGWKDKLSKNVNYYVNGFLSWNEANLVKGDVEKGKIGTYEDPIGNSLDMGVLGYHYQGMFRSQDEVASFLAKNPGYTIFGQAPKPGMLYYQDIRGPKNALTNEYAAPDGKIDANDQDYIAPKSSNHYGFGVSVGASYKSLRFDVVMSGAFGGQNSVEGAARKIATITSNRPAFWTDHWMPDNVNAAYPNPYYNSTYDVASSFWFRSAFSFRMRSANLSYSLPSRYSDRIGFSGLKAYISATNPVNFYNPYDYKDPASGSYDSYPNLRTIAVGISASL